MKIFLFKKQDFSYMFIGALIVILIFSTCISLVTSISAVNANAQEKLLPIYGVNTDKKEIALTFNCAWENSDTDVLLEIFKKYEINATFFATGDWCNRYPEDVKRIFENGNPIENHSYNHPHVAKIDEKDLIADTKKCDDIIESITGVAPTLYRAPYGEYSNAMLKTFQDKLKHKVIQFDCDSVDWRGRESEDMAKTILNKVRNGSILLFHNDVKNTPTTLEIIIPKLQEEGYKFVLVKDLIYFDNFKLDNEGRQSEIK